MPAPFPEELEVEHHGRRYTVVVDPEYGFRRLDPLPSAEELSEFYTRDYYDLVAQDGGRAHEIRRLLRPDGDAAGELAWLQATIFTDIAHVLGQQPGRRVIDIGCGRGDAIEYLRTQGFEVSGIEPSTEMAAAARDKGLPVAQTTLQAFMSGCHDPGAYDAVLLLCVLEHVPDPAATLADARRLLRPGGLVVIRVPNDFNALQLIARRTLHKPSWWIAPPDHVNYFSFDSLGRFLDRMGFDVAHAQGDFPMEMFLLMGDDYVGNDDVGTACHARRVRFEQALPAHVRRQLYTAMASVGVGRDCLVFGRARAQTGA